MRPLPIVALLFFACSGGGSELCSPDERCGDGVDNDCDGAIDEECACTPGSIQACGAGACAGEQQCEGGIWGTCYGGTATDEVCDGQDNDCDGVTDDGNAACGGVCELAGEPGAACDGDDADACAEGAWACAGTNLVECTDTTGSVFELCGDAADNNCDGRTDEYCAGAQLRWIDHGGATAFGARAKAMAAAVGADGSIYVVGYHDRVTTFGAGAASWDAGNRTDGFIVKYAADGALVWHHPISGAGDETCDAIAIDADGSLLIAGTFGGSPASSVQFAAGVVLTAEGGVDGYVARFTSDGGFVAVRQLASDDDDEIGGVAVGPDGEVAVTGGFLGAGLHAGALTVPRSNNSWSFFVVTLDAALVPAWTRRIELVAPASGPVRGTSVGFDAAGDLYVGGSATCYVECTAPALGVSRGEPDELAIASPGSGFVATLAPTGALRWAKAPAHVDAVAVLPGGAVYVAGAFAGTVVFGVGEATQTTLVSAGTTDGWLGRYGANGGFAWARRFGSDVACFGGTPGDVARALAITGSGTPVVTGSHNGTLAFDDELSLPGDGWGNVFWAGYQADGVLSFAHNGKIGELPCSGGGDAAGIAVAPNGDMVVVGNFVTHLILPTETVVAPNEFFVAVFAASEASRVSGGGR